jgi:hypothetical protein
MPILCRLWRIVSAYSRSRKSASRPVANHGRLDAARRELLESFEKQQVVFVFPELVAHQERSAPAASLGLRLVRLEPVGLRKVANVRTSAFAEASG